MSLSCVVLLFGGIVKLIAMEIPPIEYYFPVLNILLIQVPISLTSSISTP
jgi:hypothetical protein